MAEQEARPELRTIWYVSKYLAIPPGDELGGRGYELMREIAALGHACVVMTSDSNHLAATPELGRGHWIERRDDLTVCWIKTVKYPRATSWRRVLSWCHFEVGLLTLRKRSLPRPDVIIASSLSLLSFVTGLLLARRYRAKLIVEVRDIWPLTLTEVGGVSRWHPFVVFLGWIERLGYRRADVVVGTMPNLAQHVAEVAGPGIDVRCIPMGFAERVVARQAEPAPRTSEPGEPLVVLYAGTIGLDNALEPLFEAARRLEDDPRFVFQVLGDGMLRPRFEKSFGHLRNVEFLGRVPKGEVHAFLDRADVLYFSTHDNPIWGYGQSLNKLIDYMLAARPIIGSFGGHPSMIDEADCGSFVPAGSVDALVEEFRRYAEMGPEARLAMGRRAREWVLANRSYRRLALDYLAIIEAPMLTRAD